MDEELQFVRKFTEENPKNYQLWQHRQVLLGKMDSIQSATEDLKAIEIQLAEDSKNIHCWQYRQWLVNRFKLPLITEFEYTAKLLRTDVYNNSAWNHRAFLLSMVITDQVDDFEELIESEFQFVLRSIDRSTEDNECVWNYIYHLMKVSNGYLSLDSVLLRLSERIGAYGSTNNYLYLKFLINFDGNSGIDMKYLSERLKKLHPINTAFWSTLVQK